MTRFSLAITALTVASLSALACSSNAIPIGKDMDASREAGKTSDGGSVSCGSSTCTDGQLCCEAISCALECTTATSCPVFGRACPAPDAGKPRDGGAPARLTWYQTCGDPVCETGDAGPLPDADVCPTVGTACSTKGEACGISNPRVNCGATFVCDDHDPTMGGEGCPISSRKFKDDIEYVGPEQLGRLHDETLRMELATYNYKGKYADPNPKHLGFIIEDNPQSLAVNRGHDRVDMYGYLSMVVATVQVQEKEIQELKAKLEASQRSASETCE